MAVRPRASPRPVRGAWFVCLAASAGALGIATGGLRLDSIDGGALRAEPGTRLTVTGALAAVPRRDDGQVRMQLDTPDGRVMVEVPEPVGDSPVGSIVRASGRLRAPGEWEEAHLARLGVARILAARVVMPTGERRTGLAGGLDRVRARAESALGRGTSPGAGALLRGFVLGQDDRIDARTVDDFKRSGLAHLLAVSGQNVVLLATLAAAILAVLGVGLRARLAWILLLIVVYVPVAGAGASIQRAGVMGAAGVVAALAGRPRSRWYAVLLAAVATLALNPRASGDVGWQLSFAAVIGILLGTAPLAALFGGGRGPIGRAVAEGAAVTVSATLATAPLMAFHFGTASLVAIPANLIALPAVAPVMWLGMLGGTLGQLPWVPVEPITWLAGLMAGFIAQTAAWLATPGWALAPIDLPGSGSLAVVYCVLAALAAVLLRSWARRRGLAVREEVTSGGRIGRARAGGRAVRWGTGAATLVAVVLASTSALGERADHETGPPGLRVRVLDVGQGDAILLEPRDGAPLLVDTGPPEGGAAERLAQLGITRLAAVVITHPQSDHSGALDEVLSRAEADRLVIARADRPTLALARAAGAAPERVSAGDVLRQGRLRIEVLWPPEAKIEAARASDGATGDPNGLSLVLAVRWGGFTALLTGDAESEIAPYAAPPADLLKLAHHGSEDAGLQALLTRSTPALAVISAGDANPFGHPAAATLSALEQAGVAWRRTDAGGEIVVESNGRRWTVR